MKNISAPLSAATLLLSLAVSAVALAGSGNLCSPYTSTQVEMSWGDYTRIKTSSYGNFDQNSALVLKVVMPAAPASYATNGNVSMAEWDGPPTFRHMTISRYPCDFRGVDPTGMNGPLAAAGGLTPLIFWNVGAPPLSLTAGGTYYFNYRNYDCPQSSCGASTTIGWPH